MRERLIELLNETFAEQYEKRGLLTAPHTAEALIANGVTIWEWIPVSEPPVENGIYCVMVENHKSRKCKKRTHAKYKNGRWLDLYDNWENRCWDVTHWMPLPEPPEGEV